MSIDPFSGLPWAEVNRLAAEYEQRVQLVRSDPAWEQLRAAVEDYEAVSPRGSMYHSEDGSYFWVPDPEFDQRSQPALEQLLAARLELRQRHGADAVHRAIWTVQESARQPTDYTPGTDVDGYSDYEPYGDPGTRLEKAVRRQDTALAYGNLSPQDLRDRITELNHQIQEELRGDNFTTIGRLTEQIGHLRSLLPPDQNAWTAARLARSAEHGLVTNPIPVVPSLQTHEDVADLRAAGLIDKQTASAFHNELDAGGLRAQVYPPAGDDAKLSWRQSPAEEAGTARGPGAADRDRATPYGIPPALRGAPLASSDQAALDALRSRMDSGPHDHRPPSRGTETAPGRPSGATAVGRAVGALRAAARVFTPSRRSSATPGPVTGTSPAPIPPRPTVSPQSRQHLGTDQTRGRR